MTKSLLHLLCAAGIATAALPLQAQVLYAPDIMDATNFAGTSFTANWAASPYNYEGVDGYLLTVYGVDKTKPVTVTDNLDLLMDQDYMRQKSTVAPSPMTGCKIKAELVNADGITKENSTIINVRLYDTSGKCSAYGTIETLAFNQLTDGVLDVFEAFGGAIDRLSYVELLFEKYGEQCVGDLKVHSITYTYDTPKYLYEDHFTTATSQNVTDLNPEEMYYYHVKAKKGETISGMSKTTWVDGFLAPVAASPTSVTTSSYTANWLPTPKADKYVVSHYELTETQEGDQMVMYEQDFSCIKEGTYDSPKGVGNLNNFPELEGWSGQLYGLAEGMLGCFDGYSFYPGYLVTPKMDLSGAGGVYTVKLRAKGTPGDYLSFYRTGYIQDDGTLNIHATPTFPEDGWIEETWTMTDGAVGMTINIEPRNFKKFFIDEITITQEAAGGMHRTLLSTTEIEGKENTSLDFSGLDNAKIYGYTVQAKRTNMFGYKIDSDNSKLIEVYLVGTSGIDSVDGDTAVATVASLPGQIIVNLPVAAPVSVFTTSGALIYSVSATTGTVTIPATTGIYLVKVGNTTTKLAVR